MKEMKNMAENKHTEKFPKIDLTLYMSNASLVFSEELLCPESMKQYFSDQKDKNEDVKKIIEIS